MRFSSQAVLLSLVTAVSACQREHGAKSRRHANNLQHVKRAAEFPPVLSEQESILVNTFDSASISDWSYYYAHGDHIGGRNRTMAQWTADRWSENGVPSTLAEYHVYLNYPLGTSLELKYPNGTTYVPTLIEEPLAEDDVTNWDMIPSFHGYSASGSATAEYVYVGRGQQADFKRLVELGVPLEGKIALAKYGGAFRGLKVKNAQEYGMIGCVIFTDPGDDGNVTEAKGVAPYPDGPARNPTSIQRGSVLFLSTYPGDPTTPGYPSREDSPRADISPVTPEIPSLPISWIEAVPLLAALDGFGTNGSAVNRSNWIGGLNVSYSTGPAPGVVISMENSMEDAITPIWNTIGIINGTNSDETIIIGNHRDAWIIGGAADPNSGSAVLVELSKAFGRLLSTGWKPKRTIVFASWDAEEYGLVGSTEWVEEYIPWLTNTAISYLNIDIAVSGPRPGFAASPELHSIVNDVMKKVIFPQGDSMNETMYDVYQRESKGEIYVLGSGSDYTAFVHRGIGAVDMGCNNGPDDPVYHYHTSYDTYHWMATYGDPGFRYHTAMGQYIALLAYHLADDELLPLDIPNYTAEMRSYYEELLEVIAGAEGQLDTSELSAALDVFDRRAGEVVALGTQATQSQDAELIRVVNHKLRDFQRGFISQGGLPDREFFQHAIFAPGVDTGYAPVTFPGITEAVEAGNFSLAAEWVSKTSRAILRAADILKT